jgi:hypothetical protein
VIVGSVGIQILFEVFRSLNCLDVVAKVRIVPKVNIKV